MSADARLDRPIKLSICIPTYNFGDYLGETLESILPQASEGVEVVVLDGGSTDDTPAVARAFQARYPALRYHRREQRGGIDRDMALTVELARGEYCWLFSADDVMTPGAIAQMLAQLRSGIDVYLCGLTICTCEMQPLHEHPILDLPSGTTLELAREQDWRLYFERARSTTAFFSFLGSVVCRKALWESVELDERFVGSYWGHVARMFAILPSGLRLRYLAEPYLLKRADNDSFMTDGLIRRFAVTIDGFERLADTFFGHESFEAHHIRNSVAAEFPLYTILYGKWACGVSREDRALLERLVRTVYADPSPRNQLYRAIYARTPVFTMRTAADRIMRLARALASLRPSSAPAMYD
jgi:abequosyltransferase